MSANVELGPKLRKSFVSNKALFSPYCTQNIKKNYGVLAVLSAIGLKRLVVTLLYTDHPKLCGVLAVLSAIGLKRLVLTLLHTEHPKLYGVLAVLSAIGLKCLVFTLLHTEHPKLYGFGCGCSECNRVKAALQQLTVDLEAYKEMYSFHHQAKTKSSKEEVALTEESVPL